MDLTYGWYPFGVKNPFIQKLISHENNTIVFDGYFYVETKALPVQRIMMRYSEPVKDDDGNMYRSQISCDHVEIIEKISGEDTSFVESDLDSDEENICLFPTEITTLKYRIIKSDLTTIEYDVISEIIKERERAAEREMIKNLINNMSETD
jgi:hypothetical protein